MSADTLFRLASMSKPIGAALTVGLVQDGTIALDNEIARWLPEAGKPARSYRPRRAARLHDQRTAPDHRAALADYDLWLGFGPGGDAAAEDDDRAKSRSMCLSRGASRLLVVDRGCVGLGLVPGH